MIVYLVRDTRERLEWNGGGRKARWRQVTYTMMETGEEEKKGRWKKRKREKKECNGRGRGIKKVF